MITLPKTKQASKKADLCKCRPICKSRRREWKGELQSTSDELNLERKPVHECFRRWPTKVYPNSPCPLFARTDRSERSPKVVRICQAPIDDVVETPYLNFAQMVHNLGVMDAAKSRCPFCECSGCCSCESPSYAPAHETRDLARRRDMREFDARVKREQAIRIMYR